MFGSLIMFAGVLAPILASEALAARVEPVQAEARKAPKSPDAVVDFLKEAGPDRWFAKNAAFDRSFRDAFHNEYAAASRGELNDWEASPDGALALLILLDQYPRNSFRGTPKMYATDAAARAIAARAIAAGHDQKIKPPMRLFFYLPFGHSESLADQERSVALVRKMDPTSAHRAEHHRDIIRRFGRFPHRNAILGRQMTPEEQRYLDEGGYAG